MFFIFIAGVQPRERTIEDAPKTCPRCGKKAAKVMRKDLFFSFFFIPLFPVKKGDPYLRCTRCGYTGGPGSRRRCPSCGSEVPGEYNFCPFCGQRL